MSAYFSPLPERDARLFSRPPTETKVLIIGSGPAGLVTAYLLARRGIPSAIVERHALRLGQPKAHALNPRSLEILRQAGLDTTTLRQLGTKASDAFWVRFVAGLAEHEVGKLPYERQDDAVRELTPEPLFNMAQPALEEFVQEAALGTGLVTIHRPWRWQGWRADSDGAPISQLVSGDGEGAAEVRAEYVVGADGGESAVRAQLTNVEWAAPGGQESTRHWYRSVHVRGNLRQDMAPLDRLAQLYFCVHPDHRCGLIVYNLDNSFVHATMASDPALAASAPATTEMACRAAVTECLGHGVEFAVESVNLWSTWPRVASVYSSTDARVLLVGDAAHSFPPQGGLGVNTGIADAHNLVCRLALLLHGQSDQRRAVLDAYTVERKPVATSNALQSAANERVWRNFMQLTGHVVAEAAAHGVPVAEFFARPNVRVRVDEAVAQNKPHFDSLALQVGYVYGRGDGTVLPSDCSNFNPTALPGARLPHAWIGPAAGTRASVLDLVPEDGFVVFHQHGPFHQCTFTFSTNPVTVAAVDVAQLDVSPQWKDLVLGDGCGGLLVRPDQHILAVVQDHNQVEEALRAFLGFGTG